MKTIAEQPSNAWERYLQLSPPAKSVMRMKSLLHPPTSKTMFRSCMVASALPGPDGKAWTDRWLQDIFEELRNADLLTQDLACIPELLHAVAADAVASDVGQNFSQAIAEKATILVKSGYYYSNGLPFDVNAVCRLLRLGVYGNDPVFFGHYRDLYDKALHPGAAIRLLASVFSFLPLRVEWVSLRHPQIQNAVFAAMLQGFLVTGVMNPALPPLIDHYRPIKDLEIFGDAFAALMEVDLLTGRLDLAKASLAALGETNTQHALLASAALEFLEGDNAKALEHYQEARKLYRKITGKMKFQLVGVDGVFFSMTLLKAGGPKMLADALANTNAALSGPSDYSGAFAAIGSMICLAQGLEAKAIEPMDDLRAIPPNQPLSAACVALAEFALGTQMTQPRVRRLTETFSSLRTAMPLIARIYAEILAKVATDPAPYQSYLADATPCIGMAFTNLLEQRAPWERALESLGGFLSGGAQPKATGKAQTKAKRLAWFINPDTLHIEVAEQGATKIGWSDGRAVSLKRLYERDPKIDYLTDQDRNALQSLRRERIGWHDDVRYEFNPVRTLPALVGHPAVFNMHLRLQPIELVSYPLELVVTERKDGYHIALSHSAGEAAVFLEPETPARYRVIEFPQRLLGVQEILGHKGLSVPKHGRDQVIALVQCKDPTLPVRADIAEMVQAREGVSTPVVQLAPFEEGFHLKLAVRPFGTIGPAYVAGLGGRSVIATIDGQQERANRDLPQELAERNKLVSGCALLRERLGPPDHEMTFPDQEEALELLLQLQAYANPVAIEWPEGDTIKVSPVSPSKFRLRVAQSRDWFSLDGEIALDDEQVLDMRYLLDRLDRAKGRFVPLDDGRFVALTQDLQSRLNHLAAVSEPHKGGRRVHALGAPALRDLLEDAGDVKADTAWKQRVKQISAAENWTPELPSSLQADLRDYQIEGFLWMSRLARWGAGACLADDMGLGKTVQTIAVLLSVAGEGPSLVVAPTSVCPNWVSEIIRFAPTLTPHKLATTGDRAALIDRMGPRDVLICSYGLLHQEAELLASKSWQMAVLDEAQAIKNADTKRAQASQGLQARFRLALSGTPVENYLDELWSLFNFANPGLLGSRESFGKRFGTPIERDQDAHARQALRALVKPFLLRRTKAAVLSELPPRTEQTMQIEMGSAERAFYEIHRQKALEAIAGMNAPAGKRKLHILAEITKLRRACCNPSLIDPATTVPSSKLENLLELIDELLRNRHKALIFSQFVGHLQLVRDALDARGIRYEYLDGQTPATERERRVAAFQAGGADLFLISLRAGGTGLNLTAADYVVHLDPWWNPAVEDQASDRAHRIGQTRPVTIYRLIMEDSIEEKIVRMHRDKRNLASDLLDGTESAGRLSEDELMDLIRA